MSKRFVSPIIPLLLLCCALSLTAAARPGDGGEQASQSDWSGGPGVEGPVAQWGDRFHQPVDVAWPSGNLALGLEFESHATRLVDDNFTDAWSVCAGDFDGDGDIDLAGAAQWYDDLAWYENLDGAGTQWQKRVVLLFLDGARSVHGGDIDGDGDLDMAGAGRYANSIVWVENLDGEFTSWTDRVVDDSFSGASWVHVGDVDGDGDMDLLGAAAFDDEITWWENVDGDGLTWAEHVVDGDYDAARVARMVDFDGDGDTDVAAGCGIGTTDDMAWYENLDGQGLSWEKHDVSGAFTFLSSATAADMDGDGDTDMLGSATGLLYDGVYWVENLDGAGTSWADQQIDIGQYEYVTGTYPVDLDGDGDMDVIGTGNHDFSVKNIIWWENLHGTGIGWQQHVIGPNWEGTMITAADINGDGFPDPVCAGEWMDAIAWWDGTRRYKGSGTLDSSILDTGIWPRWGAIDWQSEVPGGTEIWFRVRSSDDETVMGEWSAAITAPGSLEGLLGQGERYVQYQAVLESVDPAVTPRLDAMAIDWTGGPAPGLPRLAAGPGPAPQNPPLVRVFPPEQDAAHETEFTAYGAAGYGTGVTSGDVDGDGLDELLTGAGPGEIYGPHVRGFTAGGDPLAGVNFMAYGTNKWGVNVAAGDIDGDGFDEIVTGAGPGPVFGPHVRGFDYDGGGVVQPVAGVNFMAYGTNKWGVNVAAGDIDGDGFDEIVTGAGPGPVFGPHVRGWNVDGGETVAIPAVSYMAYGTNLYGVRVACGDVDGDGIDELLTGPGPSPAFASHVRGWNFDGTAVEPLAGFSFLAWPSAEARFGVRLASGADLDLDGRDELVVAPGPDPAVDSPVRVYAYDGGEVTLLFTLEAFPLEMSHGAGVAAGRF